MIQIHQTQAPLEIPASLSDLFGVMKPYPTNLRHQDIDYSYSNILTLKEPIGTKLETDTLVYYPMLCKALRRLERLDYQVSISLHDIPTLNQIGLDAIAETIAALKEKLSIERVKKARLDAEVNNLIYLHGQEKTVPVFRNIKPYFIRRRSAYDSRKTPCRIVDISGIQYYFLYFGSRFGNMKALYQMTENQLLKHYFETNKNNREALSPNMKISLIGGYINTPVFAFRAKWDYKQAGKKYYIDLSNHTTMTRLPDARNAALSHQKAPQLMIQETTK